MSGNAIPMQHSIITRLLKISFSIYLLVSILTTSLHIGAEYIYTKKNIIQELYAFEKMFSPILAKSLWDMDQKNCQAIIEGIMQSPVIKGIQIKDNFNQTIGTAGIINDKKIIINSSKDNNLFSNVFEHKFSLIKENYKIGEVVIYSDINVVLWYLKTGYFMILMNEFIKFIILLIFFLWSGHRLLSQPLSLFANAIEKVNLENLKNAKIEFPTIGKNELWILKNSFNEMLHKLDIALDKRKKIENNILLTYETLEKKLERRSDALARTHRLLNWEVENRLKADQALQNQLHFLQTLIDSIPNPVLYKNLKGKYMGCNKAFEACIGLSRSEIIGKSVYDIYPKNLADIYHNKDLKLFNNPGTQIYEGVFESANGKIHDVIFNKATFVNRDNSLGGLVGVMIDITEQKKTTQALKKSEEMARALLNATSDAVVLLNSEGIILDINTTYAQRFQKTTDQMLGMCIWDFFPLEVTKIRKENIKKVFISAKPLKMIDERKGMWNETNIYPVSNYKGKVTKVAIFAHDITQQKQAEIESKKRAILDLAVSKISFVDRDIIHFIDKNMNIIWASKAAARVHNISLKDIIGSKCYKSFWNKNAPCEGCPVILAKKTQQIERAVIQRNQIKCITQGSYWEIYSIPLQNTTDDDANFVLISRNITEKIKSEKTLKESEQKLRFLANRLLTAQEQERKRIAFELHDEMGQSLAVLKLQLNSIKRGLNHTQKQQHEEIRKTIEYTDIIIENVRRLARDLTPSVLEDLGLTASLRWLMEGYSERFNIITSYEFNNIDSCFNDKSQIIIYRIFQEILNNSRKHAQPDYINAIIKKKRNSVFFEVKDKGKGFDVKIVNEMNATEKGLGLAALEERIKMLGGYLDISSIKGKGTWIKFIIPINKGDM